MRTWLNVGVLSLIYVLIIWHQGLYEGMLRQVSRDVIKDEIAGGQYWQKWYDPYEPISLDEGHGVLPAGLEELVQRGEATPILVRSALLFPAGRMQTVILKGIEPGQAILSIPSTSLRTSDGVLPVLIGRRMAKSNSYKIGDAIAIRWRDSHGTFDAVEGKIVQIMDTNVPTIDTRQLWIPLKDLQRMARLANEATMVVVRQNTSLPRNVEGWIFRDDRYLLSDVYEMVKTKRVSSIILYLLLLFLALLAIFDTQVLSIFKRRKEIGTLIALGLTRAQVIKIFTIEGFMNGILALAVGAFYGIPLLWLSAVKGIPLPNVTEGYGFAIPARLIPSYSAGLVMGTVLVVLITVSIVSYLPVRDIAKMNPTDALKGKVT